MQASPLEMGLGLGMGMATTLGRRNKPHRQSSGGGGGGGSPYIAAPTLSPLNALNLKSAHRNGGLGLGLDLGRQKPIVGTGGSRLHLGGANPGLEPLSPSSLRRASYNNPRPAVGGGHATSPLRSKLSPLGGGGGGSGGGGGRGSGQRQLTPPRNHGIGIGNGRVTSGNRTTYESPLGTAMPRYSSPAGGSGGPLPGLVVGQRQRRLF